MRGLSVQKHRFHYHASAHALSGQLTRPVQRMIEVQGGIALPTTGGVGSSRVEDFRVDEVLSFKKAYSHVSGSIKEENGRTIHTTQATATIEGLNILDVVTADRIVARLTSSFEAPVDGKTGSPESKVLLIGSKFENLRLAGCLTDVELHHELLLELDTFDAVREKWKDQEFRKMADETLSTFFAPGAKLPQRKLEPHGALLCSIVKEVHFKEPGFESHREAAINAGEKAPKRDKKKEEDRRQYPCAGVERFGRHRFHIRDFGSIFLAEALFQHGRKTLTMLRVELGSPNGGGVTGAEATINGEPPW